LVIYEMLQDVVRQDPSLMEAAFDYLVDPFAPVRRLAGSAPDKSLAAPILKVPALQAAS
jgi:hypothetical protein